MSGTEITPLSEPCFIELPNRAIIRVGGEDAFKFLQNLITNDLSRLGPGKLLHSCLLTAQGKFLHDFFVSRDGDDYILECEGGERGKDLLRRLNLYKLRSRINLGLGQKTVYAVFPGDEFKDPRHAELGARIFTKPDLPQKDFFAWDERRLSLGIADGSRDAEIEKSTLSELNMEETSIDYKKGCYVGQELTARIHHRGLAKKHLYPVKFNTACPPRGTEIQHNGKTIGEMRSSCGAIGLALLKDEDLPNKNGNFIEFFTSRI